MVNPNKQSVNRKYPQDNRGISAAQALFWAKELLAQNGVETPLREAQDLLAHVLKWERVKLLAARELVLSPVVGRSFSALVRRRARREPLQYLLGEAEFCGRMFQVGPGVLIPRPETELLVAEALRCCQDQSVTRILDLGTGSGCLALTLARQYPDARVWGLDVSPRALKWARSNRRRFPEGHCRFVQGNAGRDFFPAGRNRFSLVVSNPPYIPQADLAALQPEVLREPRLALSGGKRGLKKIEVMLRAAGRCLAPGGAAVFEIGIHQAPEVVRMFSEMGFGDIHEIKDWNNIIRIVSGVKKQLV
ncbi:MAG: peptide chain release factor N(5)-glutamine methyltransferase [Candidatus Firestonebacteria bacterium]|nr:peptide chain release factor N(5)-glutamine methyltransferase [Candidatus Firestonebacteria bacterium]